jgi:hypothetical protein
LRRNYRNLEINLAVYIPFQGLTSLSEFKVFYSMPRKNCGLTAELSGQRFAFNLSKNITLLSAPMFCYAKIAYQLLDFVIADHLSGLNNVANHLCLPNLG